MNNIDNNINLDISYNALPIKENINISNTNNNLNLDISNNSLQLEEDINISNTNNNKITIILSRYKEKITWINKIIDNKCIEKIIIYNKNENYINFKHNKVSILNVKNVGREGGTYLDYIIDNYDNFPDNLIFTQADPFTHNENFLDFLQDSNIPLYIDKDICTLTKRWKISANMPPEKFVKYNNSYNIGNLELIEYYIRDYDQNIVGHSTFYDPGVSLRYQRFKNIYKNTNITNTVCI